MRLDANTTWFNFTAQSGDFSVYAFRGHETVCKPYEFHIELVGRSANADIASLLGTPACLSIADRSGGTRLVHGLIREMRQLHTGNLFTHYACVIVPRLWFLGQIIDHRIFQNLSVVEIIQQILREQGFTAEASAFKLCYTYEPREYCVQYGETDLHFITRLCEEEGIYFYFEHTEEAHTLCFCDREGGPKIPGESDIRFYPGSGNVSDTAVISRLNLRQGVNSNAAAYAEWNFQHPKLDLLVAEKEPDTAKAPAPPGMLLEQYRHPHLYQLRAGGTRYTKLQVDRQLTFAKWIDCESDVSRYLPSCTFGIYAHPRYELNARWWVVSVSHEGEQPGVLEHEAPDSRSLHYKSMVRAIPEMTRFIPEPEHPKNRVDGLQSAVVTGPVGEEVYTDEYGRVKVQFHWDRLGVHDENTTCWVRVADSWAGTNFGFIQVPRIGQEVMVEYMEGDPDRPVITGRVYNADRMPPWELPGQKTLSGIQSREFHAGRRNQLVLDDTQNEIQAQISSDHGLSQLNLGYITRVNHVEGRKEFRGEGFELRTDGWGVVRAAKGMYISTDARLQAEKHHKDLPEVATTFQDAVANHEAITDLARVHKAQDDELDGTVTVKSLRKQADQIQGPGRAHEELNAPHLVLSSPAGIAAGTPDSLHIQTGESTAVTTGRHLSVTAGRSILASALGRVSLFAHKLGIRLFAGAGKVEIQAQSGDVEIIADKVLQLISAKSSVQIAAAKEILLMASGSYLRISDAGIEQGTKGRWVVHAASRQMTGPDSMAPPKITLPEGAINFDDRYVVLDAVTKEPVDKMRYEIIRSDGGVISGTTGKDGIIPKLDDVYPDNLRIRLLGREE